MKVNLHCLGDEILWVDMFNLIKYSQYYKNWCEDVGSIVEDIYSVPMQVKHVDTALKMLAENDLISRINMFNNSGCNATDLNKVAEFLLISSKRLKIKTNVKHSEIQIDLIGDNMIIGTQYNNFKTLRDIYDYPFELTKIKVNCSKYRTIKFMYHGLSQIPFDETILLAKFFRPTYSFLLDFMNLNAKSRYVLKESVNKEDYVDDRIGELLVKVDREG